MKRTIALLVLSTFTIVSAQQPPPAAPAVPAAPPAPVRPPRVTVPVDEEVQRVVENAKAVAGRAASMAESLDQQSAFRTYGSIAGAGTTRGSRTLVIHSLESDPAATANTEEDLAIMARILDKAARNNPDDGHHSVLGINVDGSVFGSSSGARNIYLEGYGALFLLSVKYPLIAPPEKPEEPKLKDTSSDDWKRARDEIQGALRGGSDPQLELWASNPPRGPAEEFDADRVEKLKDSLLEALKNATHIRALKPNDFVTVVVQGAEAGRTEVVRDLKPGGRIFKEKNNAAAGAGFSVNATGYVRKSGGPGQTVMTFRVKKSDADAFAQGKLTAEEFRKKAVIQSYLRKSDASTAANFFMQPAR